MSKFKEMSFAQLREKRVEVQDKISELYESAMNRELTAEEKVAESNYNRELQQIEEQMKFQTRVKERELCENNAAKNGQQFREMLKNVRNGRGDREILLNPASGNTAGNIVASGAINLSIKEMIPTLNEGLGLPVGLNLVTGVEGDEVWPVSTNDVELEEVGEVVSLNDQVLNFANIKPNKARVGATVPVSNMAIDNAAFDVLAFVQAKFGVALKKYLAEKIYSQAAFTGIHGPFSGLTATDITLDEDAFENILDAVAQFTNKGFDPGKVCIVMGAATEAKLKATPKIAGAAGGFVIENGKCAGYDYVVTHYLNTTLSGTSVVPTSDDYIGIGFFEYLAVQQHGEVRLTIDATSQAVAKKNITAITMNTSWSVTDLSVYLNGGTPSGSPAVYPTQAFALYKVVGETV